MLWLPIDRESRIPLIRQIYDNFRCLILEGKLRPGEKLPGSRELSANLAVSRNVVIEAYDQLIAEGYLMGEQGSGTYVAAGACIDRPAYWKWKGISAEEKKLNPVDLVDFRTGVPALEKVPKEKLARFWNNTYKEARAADFGYSDAKGDYTLRAAITRYIERVRGVISSPEQIVVTTGAKNALFLLTRLLMSAGSEVIVEDPMHCDFQELLLEAGGHLLPIPVDARGIQTDMMPDRDDIRMIVVTPSHQFPLGSVMAIQRRVDLIKYAARQENCYIIEDDYDSEYRFSGTPVSSLQGIDPAHVIYLGTFSKIIAPALRMGYAVLPEHLVSDFVRLKYISDHHYSTVDQQALARFIEEGLLERHIVKMKKVYRRRQEVLIESLLSSFGNQLVIEGQSTGMHIAVRFPGCFFNEKVLEECMEAGVKVYPVSIHSVEEGKYTDSLVLGYGNLPEERIKIGVIRLRKVLDH